MKILNYSFRFALIIFCSFVITSCLSVSRNIVINKDGSGKETMKITFSKEFYSVMSSFASFMDSSRQQSYLDSLYSDEIYIDKTREEYGSVPGVKIIDITSERNADSSNNIVIKYEFDSIKKIGSSLNNLKDDDTSSQTIIRWTKDDDEISFVYSYEQKNPEEKPDNDSLAEQMKQGMAEMFGSRNVNFEIEFPYEVISSNATSSDGNKLTWNIPLSDIFITGKMELEATMKER